MEILQSLNIDVRLIVVNMVGFLILVFAAKKMIFTPIGKVLEERATEITTGYDRLDASQREMETLKSDYEARLAAIEAEARDKIQNAIKEAQAARDQILADANAKSREIITRAEAEANREKEQAMISLRQQIVDIAMRTTTHVVGENLDPARHQKLVDEFIARDAAEA